jgi:hypothetical protein
VANVVVSALATWNGKALKKAKQDVDVFSKQIKQFARVFGVAFSATALVAFSKKAVKAFAEDEAAAKSLALQLENTGNAFRVTEVETYIKSLEKTYAILTDLRAPFQTLLNVTGSVDLAQRSLEAALDISAGTGENLATVVGAIAAGVRGQTKAINGLNTGIDKNILATGDMNKIMAELEKKFSGQAAARLDTYAGKMDVLKKGADEATKSIGTGLVDALVILSKDQSIEGLATDFENLGNNIAFAIVEMAKLIKKFNDLVENPSFKAGLLALAILSKKPSAVLGAFGIIGLDAAGSALTSSRSTTQPNMGGYSGIPLQRAETKAIKDSVKYRKQENEQLKKKTAVDALRDKFDVERVGLAAALNAATDEETKLRIKSQIAILDNNEALAKKYLAELAAAEAAMKLAGSYDTALSSIKSLVSKINDFVLKQGGTPPTTAAPTYSFALSTAQATNEKIAAFENKVAIESTQELNSRINEFLSQNNAQRSSSQAPMDIKVTVDAGGDRLSQAIAESIQVATRSGYSTVPNGFIA